LKKILLSICIPTYNRAEYIGEAIESVLNQITDDIKDIVEICVSDNASTDNTEKIVQEYLKNSPIDIVYFKNDINLGADKNFLKVIDIANGEYCWLLGSDDKLSQTGIKTILAEIMNNKNDIYLFNREEYSIDFTRKLSISNWWNFDNEQNFDFKNIEVSEYLASVNELGGIFSFISSVVFKKYNWEIVENKEKFVGTFYSHTYVLACILNQKRKLKIIDMPLVMCRINSGENTFAGILGDYKRLYIDYFNILIFIDVFGMDSREVFYVKRILQNQRNMKTLLAIFMLIDTTNQQKLLLLLHNLGFKKEYFILKFFPKCLLPIVKKIYKLIKDK
jgi:abequosyltransferase